VLYLIRHGQASFGQKNYDRLSPVGIQQAQILGEYLADIQFIFHETYCGKMEQQRHTARKVISEREFMESADYARSQYNASRPLSCQRKIKKSVCITSG
jgi:broad specificity phosphatase PhoE